MAWTQNFRIFVIFGKDDTVSKSLYDESFGSTFALVHSVNKCNIYRFYPADDKSTVSSDRKTEERQKPAGSRI